MDKKEQEQQEERRNHSEFNAVTRKGKPENQNQGHNVVKEAIQPINQKR